MLLPGNKIAWDVYCRVYDQGNKGLNYDAIQFNFDLYLPDYSTEERREIFEKLLLIYRTAKKNA